MYLPFVMLFPLLWTGVLADGALLLAGHVLMLPAMAAVMLLRPDEYIQDTEASISPRPTACSEEPGGHAIEPSTPAGGTTIGERIRALREGLFTHHELAAGADVSVDLIRKF